MGAKAKLRWQVTADKLRKDARSLYLSYATARINNIHDVKDEASRLGKELKRPNLLEILANKPAQKSLVAL